MSGGAKAGIGGIGAIIVAALFAWMSGGDPVSAGLQVIRDNAVDVAVLTLPQSMADGAAACAVGAGVRGIWNFTGKDLGMELPGTSIENVHLSDSLLTLGYYLRSDGGKETR